MSDKQKERWAVATVISFIVAFACLILMLFRAFAHADVVMLVAFGAFAVCMAVVQRMDGEN
ncbi:MAG: hypothetical protein IKR17_05965 [Bacteroidales bacterium]|nr:hypothetical protein [Bacteroidales bacterium]